MASLRQLLALPVFSGCSVLAGSGGLDLPVSLVTVGEVPDGPTFLCGGELVLTTFFSHRHDVVGALRAYRSAGAVGIAWKRSDWLERLPAEAYAYADAAAFPIIEIPRERRWPELIACSLTLLRRHRRVTMRRQPPPRSASAVAALRHALAAAPEVQRAAGRLVAPLLTYDREHGTQLTTTLLTFLDHHRNASATALALYLHRNSLSYRLRRIRRLTGLDFRDPQACLAWHLALTLVCPS